MDAIWKKIVFSCWLNVVTFFDKTRLKCCEVLWHFENSVMKCGKSVEDPNLNFSKQYLEPERHIKCFWDSYFSKISRGTPLPPAPTRLTLARILLKITESIIITNKHTRYMWQKHCWCDVNRQKTKKLWQFRLCCDIWKILRCDKLWLALKLESILCTWPHSKGVCVWAKMLDWPCFFMKKVFTLLCECTKKNAKNK